MPYAPAVPDAGWTQQERDAALLDHLERRRNAHDQVMWQAPALIIAGQAFLLRVIADEGLEWWARAVVLGAGLLATFAAAVAIRHLSKREVEYSRRIEALATRIGVEDPSPPPASRRRRGASRWRRPVIYWWLSALLAFMAADAVVFAAAL